MQPPVAPKHIQILKPYQPGRSIEEIRQELGLEKIVKLASNENPLGASPKAKQLICDSVAGLNTYPNSGMTLREVLAKKFEVRIDNVVAGSGSESVMAAAMKAYLQPGDEVITAEGTFIGFYVLCNSMNVDLKTIPLKDYAFDLEAIAGAITDRTKLVYLANPNNPTGTAYSRSEWETFLKNLPPEVLVFADEAYYEYAIGWEEFPDSLDYRHDQVLTLRTFSKAYGLAGVRIGYGIAHDSIITNILKVKLPFEPTTLSQAAGLGALKDHDFLKTSIEVNRHGMKKLKDELDRLGMSYPTSHANFLLIPMDSPEKAQWFSDELLKRGVIARPMIPFRLPHAVRITIGSQDEMTFLIEVLRDIF